MKRLSLMLTLVLALATMASANWSFRDVTASDMRWSNHSGPNELPSAACVAWGDINADGNADLFVGSLNGPARLYMSNGESLLNMSDAWEMDNITNVRYAQFIDYNQDGMLDLFCLTEGSSPVQVYRQTQDQRFQPVAIDYSGGAQRVNSGIWYDIDGDGALDLILNSGGESASEVSAFINNGESGFSYVRSPELPASLDRATRLCMVDIDRDGSYEIVVGSDTQARILKDYDGTFRDVRNDLGLPVNFAAYGVAWADFNQDGMLDMATCGKSGATYLYVADIEDGRVVYHDQLRTNSGAWQMLDVVKGASSVHAVDVNRDGWTDLVWVGARNNKYTYVMLNEAGEGWNVRHGPGYFEMSAKDAVATAWADYDNDGDLDCAAANAEHGIRIYRNEANNTNEYLSLRLTNGTTGALLPNCDVFVKFERSRAWATTAPANSAAGYDEPACLFVNAEDNHSRQIEIRVVWPDGTVSQYDVDDITLYGETELAQPNSGGQNIQRLARNEPLVQAELSNDPNPFNPSTTLNYAVPAAGWVNLQVFNVLGQEVAQLVNGHSEAGFHKVTFNAANLPSGLYIARLQTATTTQLHRMILTK